MEQKNWRKERPHANWLITKGKNTTFSRVWRYAEANVDITEDYQIQFTAFIESTNAVVVAIDDVKLIPGRCPETGFCDFEEDICSWKYGENRYKWDRIGGVSSKSKKIGPSFDNTLGVSNGYCIVFSSEENPEGSEATFESETFPPDEDEFRLTFYYQMSGKNLGTLKVCT
ncbi:UNVERIFIED_CONTAM: MAM and LDL-receptor class A domain-containing protein 2 [Trichonephila clavipes]